MYSFVNYLLEDDRKRSKHAVGSSHYNKWWFMVACAIS